VLYEIKSVTENQLSVHCLQLNVAVVTNSVKWKKSSVVFIAWMSSCVCVRACVRARAHRMHTHTLMFLKMPKTI
jgi:hypothetical protein